MSERGLRNPSRRRPRDRHLESGQGPVSEGGPHQAGSGSLLPRGCRGRACAAPAAGPTCSSATRTASTASSSTRSGRRSRGRRGSRSSRCGFPSGRSAEEVVPRDAAALVWMANLACLELHPHPVRAEDLDHPDELRVDLDPVPGVDVGADPQRRARGAAALDDFGLVGWPKTSGSRGMHVYVRIERRWTFDEVRRAALALAREVERRAPGHGDEQVVEGGAPGRLPRLQPEREGSDDCRRLLGASDAGRARLGAAFVGRGDVVRPARLHARRPCRARFAEVGDVHADMDRRPCSIDALLELSARQEREGLGDAPWPPHYRKQAGEPARVSRRAGAQPKHPLIEIGRARKSRRARGPRALEGAPSRGGRAPAPADVLVDAMRGRFHTWTRIRINLQHVPEALRPAQEPIKSNPTIAGWPADAKPPRGRQLRNTPPPFPPFSPPFVSSSFSLPCLREPKSGRPFATSTSQCFSHGDANWATPATDDVVSVPPGEVRDVRFVAECPAHISIGRLPRPTTHSAAPVPTRSCRAHSLWTREAARLSPIACLCSPLGRRAQSHTERRRPFLRSAVMAAHRTCP